MEGDLPHEAGPWLVVPYLPYAPVVTASNGRSPGRAQESVVNTQVGPVHSVFEKL